MIAQNLQQTFRVEWRKLIVISDQKAASRQHERTHQLWTCGLRRLLHRHPVKLSACFHQTFDVGRVGSGDYDIRRIEHEIGNGAQIRSLLPGKGVFSASRRLAAACSMVIRSRNAPARSSPDRCRRGERYSQAQPCAPRHRLLAACLQSLSERQGDHRGNRKPTSL